jgi:hypothetical protein
MSGDFEGQAKKLIPGDVRMISGCADHQTSADVSNVTQFQLPDPAGQSGGACTSALLKTLYADHKDTGKDLSFVEVLLKMRSTLSGGKFSQIPQLSSSRKMDINEKFEIVPSGSTGARRALLIGINYVGQQGQLSGCHNDVGNIKDFLMDIHGFKEEDITVLMDDGSHQNPTYDNILAAFGQLVTQTKAGDCAFLHYSGHGGRVKDEDGDEEDGYDETIIPVDFSTAGQITDDVIFAELVGRMPQGSTLMTLMDCCHSGTVLDLPYTFKADGEQQEMQENPNANMNSLQAMAISYLIKKIFGKGVTAQIMTVLLVNGVAGITSNGGGCGNPSGGGGGKPSGGSGMDMVLPLLQQILKVTG